MAEELFAGGGEMGALMRSLDWSQTLLGSVSEWTQSLKTALSIILTSRYPMFIWWGAEYANLYNDAYRPILGASKHPQFLGQSAKDCWADVWDVVGPLADSVLTTAQPTWSENLLLLMDRNGYLEEAYFTFSYSPVRDESGGVGGVFCAVTETTERIIGERRLRTLRELAAKTAEAKTVEKACQIVTTTLSINPHDIPFALLYRVEPDGKQARLAGATGIEAGTVASPEQVDLLQESEVDRWNLARVNRTGKAELVSDLPKRFGVLPKGAWSDSPTEALVIPIAQSGKAQRSGLLVVGISPRREFDDDYQGFFDLIASNVATAIANADTYEAERKRAAALAELDRPKTTFFSNISHEFRTPLTLMLGSVEEILVGNDPLSTHQREQLEVAQRNSLRLLKLVNTLLDFSRFEAGRIQAVYEPTDLATFTRELASVFRSAIERVGMQLVVDCPPSPELIYVDRDMWEKIVLNLLSNALKFSFEGKITVALRSGTDHVELDVSDTGIGIPENELPRLFERFHRVPGARGRTYEGSG
ncbi:MAG TPA: histidine kinase dimerization/phospho-acceptor domain-containing protein, partial [Waterburya sp.]